MHNVLEFKPNPLASPPRSIGALIEGLLWRLTKSSAKPVLYHRLEVAIRELRRRDEQLSESESQYQKAYLVASNQQQEILRLKARIADLTAPAKGTQRARS